MPHRPWIWLGVLASGAALLAAGHAAGTSGGERSTVKRSYCGSFIPFNNSRALFRGNAPLRRAVNWALDRTDYVAGHDTQRPWTHLLPPDAPGSITNPRLQPYGTRANIAKAREFAAGQFRDGKISVYYASMGTADPSVRAENVRRDLINLGFDPANITMRGFAGFKLYDEIGKRNSAWDIAVSTGFCSEDPTAFMLQRLFFPQNPKYLRKVKAAMRLTGRARNKALGRLDLEVMRNVAPVAVMAFSSS
jgi:ABC-type oligopeptide transport system substrate-binding subunit